MVVIVFFEDASSRELSGPNSGKFVRAAMNPLSLWLGHSCCLQDGIFLSKAFHCDSVLLFACDILRGQRHV